MYYSRTTIAFAIVAVWVSGDIYQTDELYAVYLKERAEEEDQ
jgi:hypothetical protein